MVSGELTAASAHRSKVHPTTTAATTTQQQVLILPLLQLLLLPLPRLLLLLLLLLILLLHHYSCDATSSTLPPVRAIRAGSLCLFPRSRSTRFALRLAVYPSLPSVFFLSLSLSLFVLYGHAATRLFRLSPPRCSLFILSPLAELSFLFSRFLSFSLSFSRRSSLERATERPSYTSAHERRTHIRSPRPRVRTPASATCVEAGARVYAHPARRVRTLGMLR